MIETNKATITSVTVTLKAIQVNNRQMTQAVFTQLPKLGDITNDDGELAGNLWGWVNYCPRGEEPGLRQFVVEADGVLYRVASPTWRVSLFNSKTYDEETSINVTFLEHSIVDLALVTVAQAIRDQAEQSPHVWREGMNLGTFAPLGDIHVCAKSDRWAASRPVYEAKIWSDCGLDTVVERQDARNLELSPARDEKWYERSDEFLKAMHKRTVPEARNQVAERIAGIVAYIDKTNTIRDILRDADQLFIAV
jgi:hypothetical protein